jgi:hypothetical protein
MKIPETIKVAGHDYKVFFDDKFLAKEHQLILQLS